MFYKRQNAFSIIELMIVVAIIGLLLAILIPAMMRAHLSARQKTCVNNLRQIDQAIQQWAMDIKALPTDVVTHSNVIPYLRVLPVCPSVPNGSFVNDYRMTFVQEPPFCYANNGLPGAPHVFVPPAPSKSGSPVAVDSELPRSSR